MLSSYVVYPMVHSAQSFRTMIVDTALYELTRWELAGCTLNFLLVHHKNLPHLSCGCFKRGLSSCAGLSTPETPLLVGYLSMVEVHDEKLSWQLPPQEPSCCDSPLTECFSLIKGLAGDSQLPMTQGWHPACSASTSAAGRLLNLLHTISTLPFSTVTLTTANN